MSENLINQTHLAVAAITASIVKAMEEQRLGFRASFERHLNECYYDIRDNSKLSHIGALETLKWVGQFLKLQ